ncbi:MAG: NlpC/P60 family protein [Pseudomonadota bacterium]
MILTTITPFADILSEPQEPEKISNKDSQLLYGEQFEVEESHGAYVFGKSLTDGYQGYVERDQLAKETPSPNASVSIPLTHLYPEPSFKARPLMPLSFLSQLNCLDEEQNGFTQTSEGWVFSNHFQNHERFNLGMDLADTALFFYNTPYLYGGRTSLGIDCSGLVQMALLGLSHRNVMRDSADQMKTIGEETSADTLQRNDIVFFDGHVGIMMDESNILNATARHMITLIESLNELTAAYGDIKTARRV